MSEKSNNACELPQHGTAVEQTASQQLNKKDEVIRFPNKETVPEHNTWNHGLAQNSGRSSVNVYLENFNREIIYLGVDKNVLLAKAPKLGQFLETRDGGVGEAFYLPDGLVEIESCNDLIEAIIESASKGIPFYMNLRKSEDNVFYLMNVHRALYAFGMQEEAEDLMNLISTRMEKEIGSSQVFNIWETFGDNPWSDNAQACETAPQYRILLIDNIIRVDEEKGLDPDTIYHIHSGGTFGQRIEERRQELKNQRQQLKEQRRLQAVKFKLDNSRAYEEWNRPYVATSAKDDADSDEEMEAQTEMEDKEINLFAQSIAISANPSMDVDMGPLPATTTTAAGPEAINSWNPQPFNDPGDQMEIELTETKEISPTQFQPQGNFPPFPSANPNFPVNPPVQAAAPNTGLGVSFGGPGTNVGAGPAFGGNLPTYQPPPAQPSAEGLEFSFQPNPQARKVARATGTRGRRR